MVLLLILVSLMISLANCILNYYEYRIFLLKSIAEVSPSKYVQVVPSQVCNRTELLKRCEEAIDNYFCAKNGIKMGGGVPGGEKKYFITYDNDYLMGNESEYVSACSCPTRPRILLQDGPTTDTVFVLIDKEKLKDTLYKWYVDDMKRKNVLIFNSESPEIKKQLRETFFKIYENSMKEQSITWHDKMRIKTDATSDEYPPDSSTNN